MSEGHGYKVMEGKSRFAKRNVIGFPASDRAQNRKVRVFVPFAGFDGQQLAGTGALVFEGEVLSVETR